MITNKNITSKNSLTSAPGDPADQYCHFTGLVVNYGISNIIVLEIP